MHDCICGMVWYGMYSVVVCMQCIKFYMAVGSDPWLVEGRETQPVSEPYDSTRVFRSVYEP